MQIIGEFVFLVMVDVAAHYICKWLDQDKKTVSLPVNRQERKRDHSPPAVVSWYIFANHSATILYHHFKFCVKIESKRLLICIKSLTLGAGLLTALRVLQTVKLSRKYPNLLNKFNLLFLPMLNYILAYFAFFFIFLKDTYFRELSLKIICYKAVTP